MRRIKAMLVAGCVAASLGAVAYGEDLQLSENEGVLTKRMQSQEASGPAQWVLQAYRPSYILPVAYGLDVSDQPIKDAGDEDPDLQDTEIKFQFSFKVPIWEDVAGSRNSLYAAYTQLSMWQAYNADESSPFRDTNYEPEFFVLTEMDVDVLGLRNKGIKWGAVHQSNGRGNEELSRSWNRLYAEFLFERGNFAMSLKPWYRIPEDEEEDNNPDIEDYLGYGEVRLGYKLGSQEFATLLRNNLDFDDGENHGAIQLDWTFPLTKWIRGYVQYWNGYSESLLNYQYSDERIGAGFLLSDWL
jgi:phospholipase A1